MSAAAHEEGKYVRAGIQAARVARAVSPRCRSAEDLAHLTQFARSRNCFFANFSDEVLLEVCQDFEYHPILAKKTIFKEGALATHAYLIASGRVSLTSEVAERQASSSPGQEQEQDSEDAVNVEPGICVHSRSRGPLHKRRHALHGNLPMAETASQKKDEKKEREEIVASAITKVRGVVASLSLTRMASTVSGATTASIASSAKPTMPRLLSPKWITPAETSNARLSISGPGRLGDSLVDVIRTLASRSLGEKVPTCSPVFNNNFNDFVERVEAKVKLQIKPDESAPLEPFVEFNPKYLAAQASTKTAVPVETAQVPNSDANHFHGKADDEDMVHLVPLASELQVGYMLGVSACMARKPHDSTATAEELCELLALPVERFNAAVAKERSKRRRNRETHLLNALPVLRTLDKERMERLAECFRSSTHRRGAVLCWEGEVRVPHDEDDRLQVIIEGFARTVKARTEAPQLDIRGKKEYIPLQKDVGTLHAGHVVNGLSQLLGGPEPFTVIVESAEMTIMSATHADFARLGGSVLLDSLRLIVDELNTVRDDRLGRTWQGHKYESNPDRTHAKLTKWLLAGETVAPMGVPHAYLSEDMANINISHTHAKVTRQEALRGGSKRHRNMSFSAQARFASSTSSPLRPLVHRGRAKPSVEKKNSCYSERESHKPRRRIAVSDTIFLNAGSPGFHAHAASTLLHDNDLPDDHFEFAPAMSRFLSQLLLGDTSMRYPKFPCLERLEARGAQATIVGVTPIDPLHISALDCETLDHDRPDVRVSTAPARLNFALPSTGDGAMAPLAQTAPLTRCLPKLQPDRRWKAMQKKAGRATPVMKESEEADRASSIASSEPYDLIHTGENIDAIDWQSSQLTEFVGSHHELNPIAVSVLDQTLLPDDLSVRRDHSPRRSSHPDNAVPLSPREVSPHSATSPRVNSHTVRTAIERAPVKDSNTESAPLLSTAMELDFTDVPSTLPAALEGFAVPTHIVSEALDDALLESSGFVQEDSLDFGATMDPFAGTSLANLSTTLDENSVWDHMWSVIGSGPSDSMWMSQDSQTDFAHGSRSISFWPTPPSLPPPSKMQGRHRCGAHLQTRQWIGKLGHAEKQAKQALGESSPLHVNGIDRFLRKPRPLTKRRQ